MREERFGVLGELPINVYDPHVFCPALTRVYHSGPCSTLTILSLQTRSCFALIPIRTLDLLVSATRQEPPSMPHPVL